MKIGKKVLLFILILNLTIFLAGCWNNEDITEMALAAAVGLDKSEGGDIEVTVQLVKPEVIKAKSTGSEENPVWILSASGETVFSAVRNLLITVNRKVFYSHMQLIVISEELAREGILDVLDFFERDQETQRLAYILIARGISAADILKARSDLENIPAMHLKTILENDIFLAKIRRITLIDALIDFNYPGYSPTLGVIQKKEDLGLTNSLAIKDLKVEGAAVFKLDRMKGYLDSFAVRGLLFAVDKVQSGILNVDHPYEKDKKVAFEIVNSSSKLEVNFKKGILVELIINIKAWGRLAEQQGGGNLTTLEESSRMEKKVSSLIEEDIREAVDKAQKEYGVDYFGFSRILYKKHNQYWKEIEKDWNSIFSRIPVKIKVEWKTDNSSLIREASKAR